VFYNSDSLPSPKLADLLFSSHGDALCCLFFFSFLFSFINEIDLAHYQLRWPLPPDPVIQVFVLPSSLFSPVLFLPRLLRNILPFFFSRIFPTPFFQRSLTIRVFRYLCVVSCFSAELTVYRVFSFMITHSPYRASFSLSSSIPLPSVLTSPPLPFPLRKPYRSTVEARAGSPQEPSFSWKGLPGPLSFLCPRSFYSFLTPAVLFFSDAPFPPRNSPFFARKIDIPPPTTPVMAQTSPTPVPPHLCRIGVFASPSLVFTLRSWASKIGDGTQLAKFLWRSLFVLHSGKEFHLIFSFPLLSKRTIISFGAQNQSSSRASPVLFFFSPPPNWATFLLLFKHGPRWPPFPGRAAASILKLDTFPWASKPEAFPPLNPFPTSGEAFNSISEKRLGPLRPPLQTMLYLPLLFTPPKSPGLNDHFVRNSFSSISFPAPPPPRIGPMASIAAASVSGSYFLNHPPSLLFSATPFDRQRASLAKPGLPFPTCPNNLFPLCFFER